MQEKNSDFSGDETQSENVNYSISDIVCEFQKLSKDSETALNILRKLVVHSNLLAVSMTVELNNIKQKDQEVIELAELLWKFAECSAKSSMQIGILQNYIGMKIRNIENKDGGKE